MKQGSIRGVGDAPHELSVQFLLVRTPLHLCRINKKTARRPIEKSTLHGNNDDTELCDGQSSMICTLHVTELPAMGTTHQVPKKKETDHRTSLRISN